MLEGKKILGIIPARGGSKGIVGKNIRLIGGKPLIAWTIIEAKKSKYIDRLILSSDDEEIIKVAKEWGCEVPFVRPKELAKDDTPGIDPVLHATQKIPGFDYIVLLQPTSPLRLSIDIDNCIEKCILNRSKSCVSVVEVKKPPFWTFFLGEKDILCPIANEAHINFPRQYFHKYYILNGAVYISEINYLYISNSFLNRDTLGYVMPRERSVDIDDFEDIAIFKYYLEKN